MAEGTRRAIVSVDFDIVARMLFGDDAVLRHVRNSFNDFGTPVFELIIERPDLAAVPVGVLLPRKTAVVRVENFNVKSVELVPAGAPQPEPVNPDSGPNTDNPASTELPRHVVSAGEGACSGVSSLTLAGPSSEMAPAVSFGEAG